MLSLMFQNSQSGFKVVGEVKCVRFIQCSTSFRPRLFLQLRRRAHGSHYLFKNHHVWSWKAVWATLTHRHLPHLNCLLWQTKKDMVPENATTEDWKETVTFRWKSGFAIYIYIMLLVYFVWWATWPISSPHLYRQSRSQSQRRRCWWTHHVRRRSSGTATRQTCLRGCRSCGTSSQQPKREG